MLNEEISTEDDEKQLHHLMTEVSNISEKNKKISKNNSLKSMLRSIDLAYRTALYCAVLYCTVLYSNTME